MRCCVPLEIAAHKTVSVKGDRRVDSALSLYFLTATGKLIPVGTRKYIPLFILSDQLTVESDRSTNLVEIFKLSDFVSLI